jgi:hypothetical protein
VLRSVGHRLPALFGCGRLWRYGGALPWTRYIPCLMAQAKIYWDIQNYSQVEKVAAPPPQPPVCSVVVTVVFCSRRSFASRSSFATSTTSGSSTWLTCSSCRWGQRKTHPGQHWHAPRCWWPLGC